MGDSWDFSYIFEDFSTFVEISKNFEIKDLQYSSLCTYKHLPLPAPNESLPHWLQGNCAASFVLNFCLRKFLLSADANRFELRCEPKQLMLLYYKI